MNESLPLAGPRLRFGDSVIRAPCGVRPKLMTVFTTLIGLLPILLGSGTGADVMRRIAAPMVGGLVSSTVLTLVVIPAGYLLVERGRLGRA